MNIIHVTFQSELQRVISPSANGKRSSVHVSAPGRALPTWRIHVSGVRYRRGLRVLHSSESASTATADSDSAPATGDVINHFHVTTRRSNVSLLVYAVEE